MLIEKNPLIIEQIKHDELSNVNRNTIKRIKKEIVMSLEEYEPLRDKFIAKTFFKESSSQLENDDQTNRSAT